MKALAAFIMKGRMQAVMAAAVFTVLALLITPLGIASSAVVALVVLRNGVREGLLVMVLGGVALAALGLLIFGQAVPLAIAGILLWLPMLVLGEVLRATRSLRLVIEVAVVLGILLIGVQYLVLEDVTVFWAGILEEYSAQMMDPNVVSDADRKLMVTEMAPWMAGGMGAAWFLQLALSLFLARSWQASLYNPGGFAEEIRQLRLGYWLLILVPVLLVAGSLSDKPGLVSQLALVGMAAFFLQGVALVHGLVQEFKANQGWLIGFYILLVIGMPASFTAVSAAGFADGWLNFRARVRARKPKKGGE
ncbi:MAG TPA: DUF2232 domain-containing protein [Chromatiaceae bacterium]|nr:DUF2232 domain-containing protein [Chromatiaceae bacterium]